MAWLFALATLLLPFGARAESVFFDLSADGGSLTLTQRGDATAFYPQVYFMNLHDDWQPLTTPPAVTQLAKGDTLRLDWKPALVAHPSRALQIRYFDKAGVGFGQLAFMANWPGLNTPFQARRDSDRLVVEAVGNGVSTTWVLWAAYQDERPLPVSFHRAKAPSPMRLQWGPGSPNSSRSLPVGAGQIVLLHELISSGGSARYAVQNLPPEPAAPSPFHPAWLDSGKWDYAAAILFILGAFGAAGLARRRAYRHTPLRMDESRSTPRMPGS